MTVMVTALKYDSREDELQKWPYNGKKLYTRNPKIAINKQPKIQPDFPSGQKQSYNLFVLSLK